jgi:hypothetical protein
MELTSSEEDPLEAPVSVSSDGSWRPEQERLKMKKLKKEQIQTR